MKIRAIIFLMYFIPNAIAVAIFGTQGIVGGDVKDIFINNNNVFLVGFAEIILILIFLFLLNLTQSFAIRHKISFLSKREKQFGIVVLLLQIGFLFFNIVYGAGIAGEMADVNNPIKYVFIIFQIDYLAIVFLAFSKRKGHFALNAVIYLLSNSFRGWVAGAILNLAVVLLIRFYEEKRIPLKNFVVLVAIIVLSSPIVMQIKDVTRAARGDALAAAEFIDGQNDKKNALESIEDGAGRTFYRLQHISETYFLVENITAIQENYQNNKITPFYMDGFVQKFFEKQFLSRSTINNWAATELIGRQFNIHVGILPWLITSPFSMVFYIPYLLLLAFVATVLATKVLGRSGGDVVFYFSFLYLMHGWLSAFIGVVIALFWVNLFLRLRFTVMDYGENNYYNNHIE